MNTKRDNNQTSLAGEFAVLSQLAARGYVANMTLGNAKKIDILIYGPEKKKYAGMEVKTAVNKVKNSGLFGEVLEWGHMKVKHETLKDENLFYCFVSLADDKRHDKTCFRFFIVPSKVVARYVKREHKFWLLKESREGHPHNDNPMRTFRLGSKGKKYNIETPTVEEYENNWSQLTDNG